MEICEYVYYLAAILHIDRFHNLSPSTVLNAKAIHGRQVHFHVYFQRILHPVYQLCAHKEMMIQLIPKDLYLVWICQLSITLLVLGNGRL